MILALMSDEFEMIPSDFGAPCGPEGSWGVTPLMLVPTPSTGAGARDSSGGGGGRLIASCAGARPPAPAHGFF